MLFCMFTLFDLGFEDFFELVYFLEGFCVAFLVTHTLLQSLLLYLLLNCYIVIFEVSEGRLQLHWTLLDCLHCWWYQSTFHSLLVRSSCRHKRCTVLLLRFQWSSLFISDGGCVDGSRGLCFVGLEWFAVWWLADGGRLRLFELVGGHLARLAVLLGHLNLVSLVTAIWIITSVMLGNFR